MRTLDCLFFAIALASFFLLLCKADRFFLKENGGFCISHMYPSRPIGEQQKGPFPPAMEEIARITFVYLDKGHQSFAFESEDGKYVIKFYRFPSHLRTFSNHPIFYLLSPRRKKIKDYNLQKVLLSLESYQIAYDELKEETGLVYVHLSPTNTHQKLLIKDRLKETYVVDLDNTYFVVQKKAKFVLPSLKKFISSGDLLSAKTLLFQLVHLTVSRCQKGIANQDANIEKNYGLLTSGAVHIDVGRFYKNPQTQEPMYCKKEIWKITAELLPWLQGASPELVSFLKEEIEAIN